MTLPSIAGLVSAYRAGHATPRQVIENTYEHIEQLGALPVWICLVPRSVALAALRRAEARNPSAPLLGVPFAVKDNIDVAGLPTTAGCPDYAYLPERNAFVVQLLVEAGAIVIGKTNLDQFATGLVGTRSPYGICGSIYDARYIAGGSSSGSAVAVARGDVSFALGTGMAGSGRHASSLQRLGGPETQPW